MSISHNNKDNNNNNQKNPKDEITGLSNIG